MIKTNKYNEMLSTFQLDFTLARRGKFIMQKFDELLKCEDKTLHKNIDLLTELASFLRSGKAFICIPDNDIQVKRKKDKNMFRGMDLELEFHGETFSFVEDELFVFYVPGHDDDIGESFTGRLIGCIIQDDYNAFIMDSEHGIIKIDSLDVQKLHRTFLINELIISGYKEL